MKFSLVSLLTLGAVASALPFLEERTGSGGCNADNVLRLLRATQRLDESLPFCSQYLGLPLITETAAPVPSVTATSTFVKTVTDTITVSATETKFEKRCETTISTPDFILSTTIDPSRLSSACNCLTIPLSTITITPTSGVSTVIATSTSTIVATVSVTETATVTAPILADPTSAAGWEPPFPAEFDSDDTYYRIELPFEVEIYGFSSSLLFVSVNGLIWLDEHAQGNYQFYYNDADNGGADLPLGAEDLPDIAILPFWSDLVVNAGTKQGVFYEITGSPGSRTVTLEFLASAYLSTTTDYHFTVAFSEAAPNKVTFKYYQIADSAYGTVAVQHFSAGDVLQFSRYGSSVVPGLTVQVDTAAGTIS
ncbi:hypothetical protein ABW19_dt0209688 [Dactylella cylindrospora]|nr:hypothetical protein ABW19_dt0209688 [Dactylella cylindrospora]